MCILLFNLIVISFKKKIYIIVFEFKIWLCVDKGIFLIYKCLKNLNFEF